MPAERTISPAPSGGRIPPGTPVLVTGATGFTGAVLTRKLVETGLAVRAIARESSNLDGLRDLKIQWFRGNVFDPAVARPAAQGVEYIFHVAAAFREAKHPDSFYRDVHFTSTQLLTQAALETPGFKRFIHTSTIGVHGHIENPPANEDSPFSPGDIYQVTKAEADRWVREFAAANHLPLVVIRPAAIYGPGDRRLLKLFKMALKPVFPVIGNGKCLYHMIHVDDLSDAMIHAATHPAAPGGTFIVGNADPIPLVRIVEIVAGCFGRKPRMVRLPAWPFFAAADLCERICKPLGVEPPLYRRRVAFFTKDRSFDTRRLRETLEFNPHFSYEEGLRQTARWYADHGWLRAPGMPPTPPGGDTRP